MPGSPDLDRVVAVMRELAAIACPDLPELRHAAHRWARYTAPGDDPALLDGGALLHTDLTPLNILISPDRTNIIDWACPTTGAAFIDPACLVLQLIAAGHTPESAEAWVADCPAWTGSDPKAVDAFAAASLRMSRQLADRKPDQTWLAAMADAAQAWVTHRSN